MRKVGFWEPINDFNPFENYFTFSKNRYTYVKTTNNGIELILKKYKEKWLETALKILSFLTLIIPLIMIAGKLISRGFHSFYIEDRKFCDPLPNNRQQRMAAFKEKALNILKRETHKPPYIVQATSFHLDALKEAIFDTDKMNVIEGGCKKVYFVHDVQDYVFKPMERSAAEKYVNLTLLAKQIIARDNLYLLFVPDAQVVQVQGRTFLMQQKVLPICHSYFGQKSAYLHCWKDPDLLLFIKNVFFQLIHFICELDYGDPKYDNIMLLEEGWVALVDLDQLGAVKGLVPGNTSKKDGLLYYIPYAYFDDMIEYLQELRPDLLQGIDLSKIKEHALRIQEKEKFHEEFLKKSKIYDPTQSLKVPLLFKSPRKLEVLNFIISKINSKLNYSENPLFDLKVGRTLSLRLEDYENSIYEKIQTLYGNNYFTRTPPNFRSLTFSILKKLKKKGYIHFYKYQADIDTIKVIA